MASRTRSNTPSAKGSAIGTVTYAVAMWLKSFVVAYPNFTRFVLATMSAIVAHEWRCKWSAGNNHRSLKAVYAALAIVADKAMEVDGNLGQVCHASGGVFYVITSMQADKFEAWEAANFAPEQDFIALLQGAPGISDIEAVTERIPEVGPPSPKPFVLGRFAKSVLKRRRSLS